MRAVRKLLFIVSFIAIVSAGSAFGSAANIYITQSGSPTGNCTANVQTPAFFNNAANWGSGAGQIGPGTIVLLCGTFTSSAQGGNMLTAKGSGSSGNPIVINCDTTCNFNSTGWWGNYNNSDCPTCTGAITLNGVTWITLDGKGTGVIQNMLAGCTTGCDGGVAATCPSGACTQHPGAAGTVGIHVAGDHISVKNWTIQYMYVNAGSTSAATDTSGQYSVDIRLDGCLPGTNSQCNVEVANNNLFDARGGIWGAMMGSTGPPSCPSSGVCIHDNNISNHCWPNLLGEDSGVAGTLNYYNNEVGDVGTRLGWKEWVSPASSYHTSGLFLTGYKVTNTFYVWNNYIHGDLTVYNGTSPSGLIYCTVWGNVSKTGCIMTAWNNVVVGTGYSATQGQVLASNDPISGLNQTLNETFYNNTLVGTQFGMEFYSDGTDTPEVTANFENNIFGSGGTWYYNASNGGTYLASWKADYNVYYNGNSRPWQYNNSTYANLLAWQTGCGGCDTHAITTNPNLSSTYTLQSGSPAIQAASNLTSLCTGNLVGLCTDKNGKRRPTSGAWDTGAYQYSTVAPPVGLAAEVH